ncbi:MAG: hypothetical protein KDA37_01590 [Planctomycetales bacterium]|nr:hypothetical protein [Planctomycetales bacterium]
MQLPKPYRPTNASRRSSPSRRVSRGFEPLEDRRLLAIIPVSLYADAENPTDLDNGITLREAITYVNTRDVPAGDLARIDLTDPLGTNDRIDFDSSVFGPNGSASKIELLHGELLIENSVVIDGSGYNVTTGMPDNSVGWENLTIDASTYTGNTSADSDGARIFNINMLGSSTAESVEITDLSLKGGDPDDHGGAIYAGLNSTGGADDLKLSRLYVYDNQSSKSGGGIYVNADQSSLEIEDVILEGNALVGDNSGSEQRLGGGAAIVSNAGNITLDKVVARKNLATAPGLTSFNVGGGLGLDLRGEGQALLAVI